MDKFKLTIIENIAKDPNISFEGISTCLEHLLKFRRYEYNGAKKHAYFTKPTGRTRRISKDLYKSTKNIVGHSVDLVVFNDSMFKYFKEDY